MAEIDQVLEALPTSASQPDEGSWNDIKVGAALDSGKSVLRVIVSFWEKRVADTAEYVSISESGSSRDLRTIHTNAIAIAAMWRERAEKAEAAVLNPIVAVRGTRVKQITRI